MRPAVAQREEVEGGGIGAVKCGTASECRVMSTKNPGLQEMCRSGFLASVRSDVDRLGTEADMGDLFEKVEILCCSSRSA